MGQVFSGGSHHPVTADDLQLSLEARQSLSVKPVPLLQHRDNQTLRCCAGADNLRTTRAAGSWRMRRSPQRCVIALLALSAVSFAGCQSAMSAASGSTDSSASNPTNRAPVEWPLRFKAHSFSARCYDTYGCRVGYAGRWQVLDKDDELKRSSASYGPDYLKGWHGGHGGIRNFPEPAKVIWRSKDGEAHEAEIDIGALFRDELVLHNVPREDVADLPDGKYASDPSILLEVNDRTIRIYMTARIPLRRLIEISGVMRNDRQYDVILVKTYTY